MVLFSEIIMKRNSKGQFTTENKKTEMMRVTKDEKKMLVSKRKMRMTLESDLTHLRVNNERFKLNDELINNVTIFRFDCPKCGNIHRHLNMITDNSIHLNYKDKDKNCIETEEYKLIYKKLTYFIAKSVII